MYERKKDMFTFQSTNKFYKKGYLEEEPVGTLTLTHSIGKLPEWDISLEEEFEKRRGNKGALGKEVYTFYAYLRDCLEQEMDTNVYGCSLFHDLACLGTFCEKMGYVFITSYDFTNLYVEYMKELNQNFDVEYVTKKELMDYVDVVNVKGMKCYQLMLKKMCGH